MISVVIPAYNVEKYISECLDCVQNQTYTELEIIVVDDSSTDRTYELACEYAKNDNRIKVLKKSIVFLQAFAILISEIKQLCNFTIVFRRAFKAAGA